MTINKELNINQRQSKRLPLQVFGAFVGVAILASTGGHLASATDDDTVIDVINATVPVACTISGSVDHTYTTSMLPDTTETLGPSHVKSVCNDVAGYSLYAIGFTGDSYTGDNTKLVGSLANINTGTSGPDSYWAMKAEAITGDYAPTIMNSFDNYHAIPADFTQIARFTSVTDGGTIGSNLDITYQVHASRTQTADTYTGKVKYVLVHPNDAPAPMTPLPESACSASQICYAPNTGDIDGSMSSMGTVAGSATAGKQTGVSTNGTAVLIAPNYSREGYGFAGWSTDFEATSSSVVFGPNQTITTSTTAGAGDADVSQHGLILYPVWIASAGNLQGWTGCSSLTSASYNSTTGVLSATLASMTALTDQRDGNTYTVARLADGNCWMAENLRLDADDTLGDTNKALAQGYKTWSGTGTNYGNFISLADSEDANFTSTAPTAANNATNSIYSSDGSTAINIDSSNRPDARIPRYNNNNTNRSLTPSYSGTGNTTYYQWYGYGNYYNWPAAMANTTYYDSPTATDADGYTSETVGTSLCPTGWQLPYGRNTGNGATTKGFSYLDIQMGGSGAYADSSTTPTGADRSKMWRQFPNNFVYSGFFETASASSRSSSGVYRSSTASNYAGSYSLNLSSSYLYLDPGTRSYGKYNGQSIRCLASS